MKSKRKHAQDAPPETTPTRQGRALVFERLLLLAIIAVSLLLRCYGLAGQGLECEELYTVPAATGHQYVYLRAVEDVQQTAMPLTNDDYKKLLMPEAGRGLKEVVGVLARNVHLPLYFFLMHYWTQAFGTGEWALRLPSVILSTLSVFLIFLLGRELFDRSTGLLGALLFGLMPEQIYFAQQARMYTLLVLLAIGSSYALALAAKRRDALAPYLCYALASLAGLYTHYEYLFFLAAQTFFVWLTSPLGRERKKRWLLTQSGIALAFCPWVLVGLMQKRASPEVIAWAHGNLSGMNLLGEVAAKLTKLISVPDAPFGWLSVVAAYALLVLGVAALRAKRSDLVLLCAWIVFPLGGILVSDALLGTRALGITRYWMLVAPALYLLMAVGAERIRPLKWRVGVLAAFALFLCFGSLQTARGELRRKPDRHKEMARFMDHQLSGTVSPTVLTDGVNSIPLALAYYGREDARVLKHKWVADRLAAEESWAEVAGGAPDVWLMTSGESQAVRLLEANGYRRTSVQVLFGHILVSRYSKRP